MSSSIPTLPSTKQSPFDVIVITSPDDQAACAARELIVSSCGDFPSSTSSLTKKNGNNVGDGGDASARTAQMEERVLKSSDGTLFLSSCDPYGARMGSGGGTIAALAEADEAYRRWHAVEDGATTSQINKLPTVLICHAGGESSRCPTQIVLGKAWTSLPVTQRSQLDGESSSLSTKVSNPTSLLISSLSDIFGDIPEGSVVVAASDVLLSFGGEDSISSSSSDKTIHKQKINFDTMQDNNGGVIGLAVPAPLETAKNHGVFVLDSSQHGGKDWKIQQTLQVLQKPSVSEMISMKNPACTFHQEDEPMQDGSEDESKEQHAWIDTGVITFLPDSARTLRELSVSTLKCCTRSGLKELYYEQQIAIGNGEDMMAIKRQKLDHSHASNQSPSTPTSIEEFARSTAPKICLYGDILHALRTVATTNGHDSSVSGALGSLSEKLSQHELYTCAIPTGSFVHLGTTKELLEFTTLGASDGIDSRVSTDETMQRRYQYFGKAIGLTRRANSFVSGFQSGSGHGGNVVINSMLLAKSGYLGKQSVLEHCHIECDNVTVGDGCIVSGIRGQLRGGRINVPSGLCLQLLPLRRSWCLTNLEKTAASFVCVCLNVDDGIKDTPPKTLFGLDLQYILKKYGLTETDLWDESVPESKRMLWNAKINPVLSTSGDGMELDYSFLNWIDCLKRDCCSGDDKQMQNEGPGLSPTSPAMLGLKQWKEATRLSISQIRMSVDSEIEARYRSLIPLEKFEESRLLEVAEVLMNRRHEPCNFDHVFDFVLSSNCADGAACLSCDVVRKALQTLDNVALQALAIGYFDVVGRAIMTMEMMIDNAIPNSVQLQGAINSIESESMENADKRTIEKKMRESITRLQAPKISQDAIASIILIRDSFLSSNDISVIECCDFLERAASAMTERCVSGNFNDRKTPTLERTSPIPIGATANASAPARIDLAGGWSDTPPISFEHGGKVACLAVLVDGKRPLRAQCRMVKGSSGIKLRIESRSLSDETLLSSTEVTIQTLGDLADYCNPLADCALLKCALIQLGLAPLGAIRNNGSAPVQSYLKTFCQTDVNVGFEITSQSLLPTGSGMGSSSILGGCILSAIAKCVGIKLTGMEDKPTKEVQINDSNSLIYAVLMLEQLLTTGGGWQDNIGGLVGGLKLGSSDAQVLPLQTKVQHFDIPQTLTEELNERLVLAFSGKPRLAKNILQGVLKRWAKRSSEIMHTVDGLVKGASEAIACVKDGDLDRLGEVINQYWQYKIAMAGVDSGVEPKSVRSLLGLLASKEAIVGGTLCGAGGGGFLAMLTTTSVHASDIQAIVENAVKNGDGLGLESFSWHTCTVSEDGLLVDVTEA